MALIDEREIKRALEGEGDKNARTASVIAALITLIIAVVGYLVAKKKEKESESAELGESQEVSALPTLGKASDPLLSK